MGAWDDAVDWTKGAFRTLAGASDGGTVQTYQVDPADYQYNLDPHAMGMIQAGVDRTKGLARQAAAAPQIRLAGEGNPAHLSAARERRNAQYAASGLPNVGFDPGRSPMQAGTARLGQDVRSGGLAKGLARSFGRAEGQGPAAPKQEQGPSFRPSENAQQRTAMEPKFKPPVIEKEKK